MIHSLPRVSVGANTTERSWRGLEYEQLLGSLIDVEDVDAACFRLARQVRDTIESVPSRVAGVLAAEPDQRKICDSLTNEIR